MKHIVRFLSCFLLLVAHITVAGAQNDVASSRSSVANRSSDAALEFIPNYGQVADEQGRPMPDVRYTVASQGLRINLLANGMQFIFPRVLHDSSVYENTNDVVTSAESFQNANRNDSIKYFRLDLTFESANKNPNIEAVDVADDHTNYYFPWCPNGILHVPAYHKLIYHDLYPHIDLVLYSHPESESELQYPFEYDFIVHPGGDPSQIRMHYLNPDSLRVDEGGDATISSMLGFIRDRAPRTHIAGNETAIPSAFMINGTTLRFETGAYDSSQTLIIDPPRLWGTYYGGPTYEQFSDATVDKDDNIIPVGTAKSTTGIASSGAYQTSLLGSQSAMIVKLSPSGSRLWATYYGQTTDAFAVITDQGGNIYAAGNASSSPGLSTSGAFRTAPGSGFLVKFDPSGARLWGTYYGTNSSPRGLAMDSSSNVYMTGTTSDPSGVATSGTHQTSIVSGSLAGFLTSFTPAGTRRWGTYYCGVRPNYAGKGHTQPLRIAVDLNGNILIAGTTQDTTGIATPGTFDTFYPGTLSTNAGFVAEFDNSGGQVWGTYVADTTYALNQQTQLLGLACDRKSGVLIGGATNVSNLATPGAYQTTLSSFGTDGFLMRLDSVGLRTWGTYIQHTLPFGIALDKSYDVVIGGQTTSATGVASAGEYQTTYGGGSSDAFIAKFTTTGAFHWGTYYGGTGAESAYGFVLDREGHPIIAGNTTSTNAMASSGSFLSTYPSGSSQSGFVAKFCDTVHAPLFYSSASNAICYGEPDTLTAGVGFLNYLWRQNGVSLGVTTNKYILPTNLAPGSYIYTVQVVDPDACSSNTDTLPITVRALPIDSFPRNVSICTGSGIRIGDTARGAGPPFIYTWTPTTGLDHPDSARPIASPLATTKYFLIVTDTFGCQLMDSVTLKVNPLPQVSAGGNKTICFGSNVQIGGNATLGTAPYSYTWTPGAGLSNTSQPIVGAFPSATTKYYVTVTDQNGCQAFDSVLVRVNPLPVIPTLADQKICPGTSVQIGGIVTSGTPPYTYLWSPSTNLNNPAVATPLASPLSTTIYTLTVTDANGCQSSATQNVIVLTPPTPTISADSTTVYCATDSALISTGAGYAYYLWSNGKTSPSIVAGPGTYSVIVTDGNGCTGTSSKLTIVQATPPPPEISGPLSECPNATGTYISHDSGIAAYDWTLSGGGTITGGQSTNTLSINWQQTGPWTLELKETMARGGCIRDTTITITVDNVLHPQITSKDGRTTICTGDTIALVAASGYSTYQWSSGETTPTITVTRSGDYSVAVTNSAGCAGASNPFHVTVMPDSVPHPVLTSPSNVICAGDSIELKTTQSYASYAWSSGATTPSIFVSSAGKYSVTVANSAGCTGISSPLSFTVQPKPPLQLTARGATTFCDGDSVTLVATAGYHYAWWNGVTKLADTTATISVKATGAYQVTAVNNAGCDSTSEPLLVTVNPIPNAPISGPSSICMGGVAGYRIHSPNGSTVLWQTNPANLGAILTGQGLDSVTVQWGTTSAGTLLVQVTQNGCTGTTQIPIALYAAPPNPIVTQSGAQLSTTPFAAYQWSLAGAPIPGATSQTFTPPQDGSYTVTIQDAFGCSATSEPFNFINTGSVTVALAPTTKANTGERIAVPLVLTNPNNLAGSGATDYAGRVSFDATLLAPQPALGSVANGRRSIPISGRLPAAVTNGMTLQSLDFVATLGNDTCTTLSIDTFYFPNAKVAVTTGNGEFCLLGVCMAGGRPRLIDPNVVVTLSAIRPNPATGKIEFDYQLAEPGPTTLFLQDLLGRTVKVIQDGWREPGSYHEACNIESLSNGVYRLTLRTPSDLLTKRVEVVR